MKSLTSKLMADWLLSFLKALERAIAPPLGGHHAITYADCDTEDGRIDRLALRLNLGDGGRWLTLYMTERDFETEIPTLVAECAAFAVRARLTPPNTQV